MSSSMNAKFIMNQVYKIYIKKEFGFFFNNNIDFTSKSK